MVKVNYNLIRFPDHQSLYWWYKRNKTIWCDLGGDKWIEWTNTIQKQMTSFSQFSLHTICIIHLISVELAAPCISPGFFFVPNFQPPTHPTYLSFIRKFIFTNDILILQQCAVSTFQKCIKWCQTKMKSHFNQIASKEGFFRLNNFHNFSEIIAFGVCWILYCRITTEHKKILKCAVYGVRCTLEI